MVKIKLEEGLESNKSKKRKGGEANKKKKLRSLIVKSDSLKILEKTESLLVAENVGNKDDLSVESFRTRWKWKHLAIALLILTASVFLSSVTISSCGFWATYENNFNKIVHGDERWCRRLIEPNPIVDRLKEQVVGQDDAIALIAASLRLANRENIVQLAFIGTVGTGKTLISNVLMKHFKWQENVVSLIFDLNFNVQLTGAAAVESDYVMLSTRLSECGYNLVVIDDVNMETTTIQRIMALERNLHRMAKQKLAKIVLIVIFKGNFVADSLKNFVVVEFAPFTEDSFQRCIEIHEKLLKIKLHPKDVEELKLINFTSFGCKTVTKKINLIIRK